MGNENHWTWTKRFFRKILKIKENIWNRWPRIQFLIYRGVDSTKLIILKICAFKIILTINIRLNILNKFSFRIKNIFTLIITWKKECKYIRYLEIDLKKELST